MKLTIQVREATGKAVKKLRREGILPGVVYGKSLKDPVLLSCLKNDFIKVYRQAGFSTPIELVGDVKQLVLLHDMQLDPVSDEVLTVDFLAVSADEKVSADIPVVLVGESVVEKMNEGNIQLVKDTVEVEAFPQDLPQSIEVDISTIESLNDVIFVKDLKVPSKVLILDDEDQPILTVVEIRDIEEEVDVESDEEGEDSEKEEDSAE